MSNFQELQADKQKWTLESDYNMIQKVKTMQENVVGTASLIHNSVGELTRAIHAAHTTLSNSINAFNALNFNKFLKNVRILPL
jgi:hypothetical protein